MDVAHSEMVEKELDILIERRSQREPDPDEREELWQKSVRAYNRSREAENRRAWAAFHEGQAERHRRTLEELIASHEAAAARLTDVQPKGAV